MSRYVQGYTAVDCTDVCLVCMLGSYRSFSPCTNKVMSARVCCGMSGCQA
jgi:hypothetical protein